MGGWAVGGWARGLRAGDWTDGPHLALFTFGIFAYGPPGARRAKPHIISQLGPICLVNKNYNFDDDTHPYPCTRNYVVGS